MASLQPHRSLGRAPSGRPTLSRTQRPALQDSYPGIIFSLISMGFSTMNGLSMDYNHFRHIVDTYSIVLCVCDIFHVFFECAYVLPAHCQRPWRRRARAPGRAAGGPSCEGLKNKTKSKPKRGVAVSVPTNILVSEKQDQDACVY